MQSGQWGKHTRMQKRGTTVLISNVLESRHTDNTLCTSIMLFALWSPRDVRNIMAYHSFMMYWECCASCLLTHHLLHGRFNLYPV